jgi:hypothetical protein
VCVYKHTYRHNLDDKNVIIYPSKKKKNMTIFFFLETAKFIHVERVQDTQNTRGQTLKQTKGTDIAENPTPSCHQHRHKTVTKNRKPTGQNSGTKSQIPNSNKTEKMRLPYTHMQQMTPQKTQHTPASIPFLQPC